MENRPSKELVNFEAVFYGSKDPLVIFKGPDLVYELLNDSYQSIYPGRHLLEKPLLEAVPELVFTAFPEILKKVYETGEPYISHEGFVSLKNNLTGKTEDRYFDTTFSRIDYGDGKAYRIVAIPKEVTEKVNARKKIEQSLRELEAEKDLREKFVSALTHDLRTPLSVISLSAQILKTTKDHDSVDKCVHRILNNTNRAERMIHDLLDANRLKANEELPISIEKCELEDIIANTIKDLEDLYGKRFVIQNTIGKISVYWDKMAVHRLLENLASNAVKYGTENTSITIAVKADTDFLEIRIHNLGNPISIEDQKLLFQPFQRTESAKASKQKGWGIGLSVVQGLAVAHRGSATVESSTDHGTNFIVRLPIDARNKD